MKNPGMAFTPPRSIIAKGQRPRPRYIATEKPLLLSTYPQTSYKPIQKAEAQLSLYDDYNFTGTKPKSFTFIQEEYQVDSWRDLYQKATKLLHTLDSVTFERLFREPDSKRYIASSPQSLREAWELAEGVHLEVNLSADGISGALKYFFEVYNLDEPDFTVVLRENSG